MKGVRAWNTAGVVLNAVAVALAVLVIAPALGQGGLFGPSVSTSDADAPQACTEIGCSSGLFADLRGVRRAFDKARSVKICIRDRCRIVARRNLGSVEIRAGGLVTGARPAVRLVVRNAKGLVISRSMVMPEVQEVQPNGEGCPPVCHQVHVEAGPNGRLRAA